MNEILQVITTVGFPIAMCLILCWYIYKGDEKHDKEVEALTNSLNNNTKALEKLLLYLETKGVYDGGEE